MEEVWRWRWARPDIHVGCRMNTEDVPRANNEASWESPRMSNFVKENSNGLPALRKIRGRSLIRILGFVESEYEVGEPMVGGHAAVPVIAGIVQSKPQNWWQEGGGALRMNGKHGGEIIELWRRTYWDAVVAKGKRAHIAHHIAQIIRNNSLGDCRGGQCDLLDTVLDRNVLGTRDAAKVSGDSERVGLQRAVMEFQIFG
ncbi:hypothetical protein C8J57DRAFT_1246612 [Mycena rebaudengoi]|nr:hypothetical protein C8J57DRAFT_1246612 [Mycena rebaudengoi]